jgi:hypothetical protein
MRQHLILSAGVALILAAAGSIRGEDGQHGPVWLSDAPYAGWSDHLFRPPTFHSPAGWSPSILVTDQSPTASDHAFKIADRLPSIVGTSGETFDVYVPLMLECNYEAKNCTECEKCDALDSVTAEVIAKHRQNSPVARYGQSCEMPCLSNHCDRSGFAAPHAGAAYSIMPVSPPLVAAPVYSSPATAHPPVCVHPMPIAMMPGHTPPAYHFPHPIHGAPSTACLPEAAGAMSCRCADCRCANCDCKCQCASNCNQPTNNWANCSDHCTQGGNCASNCFDCPAGYCPPGCSPGACRQGDKTCDKLEHMLEACHHLEQAGMKDQADELRKNCMAEMRGVMRRLRDAESELTRLKHQPPTTQPVSHKVLQPCTCPCDAGGCGKPEANGSNKQVRVELKLLEIDLAKLRAAECDCDALKKLKLSQGSFNVIDNPAHVEAIVKALGNDGVAKTLAEPTLMTVSGQTVTYIQGGEIPVPNALTNSIEYKPVGAQIKVRPIICDRGTIRLEVNNQFSETTGEGCVDENGNRIPRLHTCCMETGIQLEPGHTAIVCGGKINSTRQLHVEHRAFALPLVEHALENCGIDAPWVQRINYVQQKESALMLIARAEVVDATSCATACKKSPCSDDKCMPCTKGETSATVPSTLRSPFEE